MPPKRSSPSDSALRPSAPKRRRGHQPQPRGLPSSTAFTQSLDQPPTSANGPFFPGRDDVPLALRPLEPHTSNRHNLGACNVLCPKCYARHWIDERAKGTTGGDECSSATNPKFNTCCANGAVQLPLPPDPEPELYELLTSNSEGKSHSLTTHFS